MIVFVIACCYYCLFVDYSSYNSPCRCHLVVVVLFGVAVVVFLLLLSVAVAALDRHVMLWRLVVKSTDRSDLIIMVQRCTQLA